MQALNQWSTDKIIGAGLILAFILIVVGNISVALWTGVYPPTDLLMNIVTGLAGYMGRSLLEKFKKETDNHG